MGHGSCSERDHTSCNKQSICQLSQSQRFPLGLAHQGLAGALPLTLGFGGALAAALCRLAAGCSCGASSSELSTTSGCGTGAFPAACRLAAGADEDAAAEAQRLPAALAGAGALAVGAPSASLSSPSLSPESSFSVSSCSPMRDSRNSSASASAAAAAAVAAAVATAAAWHRQWEAAMAEAGVAERVMWVAQRALCPTAATDDSGARGTKDSYRLRGRAARRLCRRARAEWRVACPQAPRRH